MKFGDLELIPLVDGFFRLDGGVVRTGGHTMHHEIVMIESGNRTVESVSA